VFIKGKEDPLYQLFDPEISFDHMKDKDSIIPGFGEAIGVRKYTESWYTLLGGVYPTHWDSNFVSGPIAYVSKLITDKGAPSELIAPFEALDIEVFQV
jgi:hypothetical protein